MAYIYKSKLYYITFTFLLVLVMVISCKSGGMNKSEISMEKCKCVGGEIDNPVICYSATGESRDEMLSKEKALSDAQEGLASLVEVKVLAVSNKFKESEKNDAEVTSEIREKAVHQVVNQVLSGMRVACENVIKTPEGTYKTYIRLEIKEQNIQKAFEKQDILINI